MLKFTSHHKTNIILDGVTFTPSAYQLRTGAGDVFVKFFNEKGGDRFLVVVLDLKSDFIIRGEDDAPFYKVFESFDAYNERADEIQEWFGCSGQTFDLSFHVNLVRVLGLPIFESHFSDGAVS
jgi:hypothetical protein